MRLELYSEKVPPTGMIDGDATRRAIGKPNLGFWEVFLRESLQNSWDARLEEDGSIDFAIDAAHLSAESIATLREVVFADALPSPANALGELLGSRDVNALIIRDGGTRGLSGPAPADQAVPKDVRTDFRNFVFDIGRDPRRQLGGGTYGFGKGVLYDASSVRTCLVYTRTELDGELVDRFIATSVGSGFEHASFRYTGRHWWGLRPDRGVLPLEGTAAAELAAQLGMLTPDGGTGTTIAVLGPQDPSADENEPLEAVMEAIREATMTWAWPHLAAASGEASIRFAYSVRGEPTMLRVEDYPQIQQFALAYREAVRVQNEPGYQHSWQVDAHSLPLDGNRPRTGVLVVRRALQAETMERRLGRDLDATVALMRGPRFVVRYEKIDADPHGQYVAGVFLADAGMEDAFARSEPVTHDSWAREHGRAKVRPIGWTLNDIQTATSVRLETPDPEDSKSSIGGVAQLSRTLAENLVGFSGKGAEEQRHRPPGPRSRVELSVMVAGEPSPVRADGEQIIVDFPLTVHVRPGANLARWTVRAEPRVLAEAGGGASKAESDTPAAVIGWFADDEQIVSGDQISGPELRLEDMRLRVAHTRRAAIAVKLSKEALA
ncbi:hypothetical protein R2Q81_07070 [Microbacterium aquimaris]|uniref:hypothetical protein n=1 Tax=Microbacterium aquimaris TaxID=459816 RepID=UPI002AD5484A|nr:hypothetical protein [Microbacterium aquimaris]MDZ8275710.1 hypothetical protein [Microbacterium aquimaris]